VKAFERFGGRVWQVARIALVVGCLVIGPGRALWASDDPPTCDETTHCPQYGNNGVLYLCASTCTMLYIGAWEYHCRCSGGICRFQDPVYD